MCNYKLWIKYIQYYPYFMRKLTKNNLSFFHTTLISIVFRCDSKFLTHPIVLSITVLILIGMWHENVRNLRKLLFKKFVYIKLAFFA